MSDIRSWPSESYAFKHLGFSHYHQLKSEQDLIDENSIGTVPEAIFQNPFNNRIMSVEVKRIVGNNLPKEETGRRIIRRRKQIIWPWTSTVEAALSKANARIVSMYMIEEHHVVFVVPDKLTDRAHTRVISHIQETIAAYYKNGNAVMKQNKTHVHIIKGPSNLFDRF